MKLSLILLVLACSIGPLGAVDVVVDTSVKYQVIEGFGAAIAYYEGWVTAHPNKAQIYNAIFSGLSLDILRYRNYYYYDNVSISDYLEIYQQGTKSLGYPPLLFLSSWSPPPELKSTNSVDSGTLKQENGQFVYSQFGQYWSDSLNRFRKQGMNFTYISFQNEPDMNATYDSCYFMPNETNGLPSYAKAHSAAYQSIAANFPNRPKILGPEVLGIGYNAPENYLQPMNLSQIDGIDHHLYHGGDSSNPDSFQSSLNQLATAYPTLKKYQTEYYLGDWLQTAWLMHETLTVENAVVYLYWNLIWGDTDGLVTVYNPWNSPSTWPNPNGYSINPPYYGFKQISGFVNPGDTRVSVNTTSTNLRVSGYVNPKGDTLSVVVINVNKGATESIVLKLNNFGTIGTGNVYQTSSRTNCSLVGTYADGQTLSLPAYSVTTLVLTKK